MDMSRFVVPCGTGACVTVQPLSDGMYEVGDSKNPAGPVLVFSREELDTFAAAWLASSPGAEQSSS